MPIKYNKTTKKFSASVVDIMTCFQLNVGEFDTIEEAKSAMNEVITKQKEAKKQREARKRHARYKAQIEKEKKPINLSFGTIKRKDA